jgi:hypothetical protein
VSRHFFTPAGNPNRLASSASVFSNQMFVPSFSTRSATLEASSEERMAEPFSSKKTGSGTPQVRWREMHQSGRDSTVP